MTNKNNVLIGNINPGQAVVAVIKEHLLRMHQHFKSIPNYRASAPYWRNLETPGVLDWLKKCFNDAQEKRGVVTETTREQQGLLICTVVDSADPNEIRAAFAPSGYLTHLEQRDFYEAPQQRIPAAAFIIGYDGAKVYIDLTWVPPLDGKAYIIIWAQDILTTREKQEIGI